MGALGQTQLRLHPEERLQETDCYCSAFFPPRRGRQEPWTPRLPCDAIPAVLSEGLAWTQPAVTHGILKHSLQTVLPALKDAAQNLTMQPVFYSVLCLPKGERIATPVFALARNDRRGNCFVLQIAICKTPTIVNCHLSIVNCSRTGDVRAADHKAFSF